jgi:hypothetical protein
MIRYYNFDQRSEKWHAMREDKWSGSIAIKLLQGAKSPEQKSIPDNKYMQRGRILEPLAAEAYEKKTGHKMSHFGLVTNSKYKHAVYSPDGIEEDTVDEIKCVNVDKHMAIGSGGMPIPAEWLAQMHFGIVITELHKLRLILYNPDAEIPLFILPVVVREETCANIIARLIAVAPKGRPSAQRAKRKYIENNPLKVRENRRRAYLKAKEKHEHNRDAAGAKRKSA